VQPACRTFSYFETTVGPRGKPETTVAHLKNMCACGTSCTCALALCTCWTPDHAGANCLQRGSATSTVTARSTFASSSSPHFLP